MKKHYYLTDRFVALCYDFVLVMISGLLIYMALGFLKLPKTAFYVLFIVLAFIVYILEIVALSVKLKGTLGKYLNDMYIEPTYGKLTFGRFLFREVVLKHLLYLTGIGIIAEIIFFVSKKETIHDYLLKTEVKEKEPRKPKPEGKPAFGTKPTFGTNQKKAK